MINLHNNQCVRQYEKEQFNNNIYNFVLFLRNTELFQKRSQNRSFNFSHVKGTNSGKFVIRSIVMLVAVIWQTSDCTSNQ